MSALDMVDVCMAVIGSGAIGFFLASVYKGRAASQRRAYEDEMTEHREFYAALAMARRLRSDTQSDLTWLTITDLERSQLC